MSITPRDKRRAGSTRPRAGSIRQRTTADDRNAEDDRYDDTGLDAADADDTDEYDADDTHDTDDGYDPDESYDDEPEPDDDGDRAGRRSGGRGSRRELSATDAARAALAYLAELTGKAPIGIASLERGGDGWVVGVEVVEDRRIPSSTDILAIYQAEIGRDGSLNGYQRVSRYARGQSDRGGGG